MNPMVDILIDKSARTLAERVSDHVGKVGIKQATTDLGVSRETVLRVMTGVPVRAGSLALVELRAASLK